MQQLSLKTILVSGRINSTNVNIFKKKVLITYRIAMKNYLKDRSFIKIDVNVQIIILENVRLTSLIEFQKIKKLLTVFGSAFLRALEKCIIVCKLMETY